MSRGLCVALSWGSFSWAAGSEEKKEKNYLEFVNWGHYMKEKKTKDVEEMGERRGQVQSDSRSQP